MPSKKRYLLSRLAKRSNELFFWGSRGLFIIISESEWDLKSLVVDMTTNSAQWLQIYQL